MSLTPRKPRGPRFALNRLMIAIAAIAVLLAILALRSPDASPRVLLASAPTATQRLQIERPQGPIGPIDRILIAPPTMDEAILVQPPTMDESIILEAPVIGVERGPGSVRLYHRLGGPGR